VLPLNSILVGARRRAFAPPHFGKAACAALLLALIFLVRDAAAAAPPGAQVISEGDARKAEKVLAKLWLLYDAAGKDDAGAYLRLASKLYPDLFVNVAELRPGDLSTDLSTAVFLAEHLGRIWSAAGAAADCRNERPDIYLPLCLDLRGGTVRQLLLAKSRLHARWAEAVLRNNQGEADAEIARARAEIRAARVNDQLIAALVVKALRTLEALPQTPKSSPVRVEGSDNPDAEFTEALSEAGTLLAWMPRSPTFYHLLSARDAYRDGLWWHDKARQAKSLVISANGFVSDPLKDLRLDVEQVSANAQANWQSATKHTLLAEQSLSQPAQR
jgi:hypothetical protein